MADFGWRQALVIAIVTVVFVGAGVTIALAQDARPPGAQEGDAGNDTDGDLRHEVDGDASADVRVTQGGEANDAGPSASEADGPDVVDLNGVPLPDDEAWIFIDKSERRMVVNDGNGYHETFRVALGQMPEGDKHREGDGRTPEGEFYVCNRIRHDRFHRFLGVSYPGPEDADWGRRHRILQPIEHRAILRAHRRRTMPPWTTALGGNIGIHGYGRRRDRAAQHAAGRDWTDGCIAVTNEEIQEIWQLVDVGTPIVIAP